MMKTLAMVNITTGAIESIITCPDGLVEHQRCDGCVFHEINDLIKDDTHYYDGKDFKLYPPKLHDYYTFDLKSASWVDARTQDEISSAVEEAYLNLRAIRNAKLSACDWTQIPDAPVDSVAWAEYRQALRDLPANTFDPENPVWPSLPKV